MRFRGLPLRTESRDDPDRTIRFALGVVGGFTFPKKQLPTADGTTRRRTRTAKYEIQMNLSGEWKKIKKNRVMKENR